MRPILTILTASLLALPATAALQQGVIAPDFSTTGVMAGKSFPFSLKAALKKGPVVLYFYPAAFTSGCTVEAHEFAEATDDFKKLGATVIGASADSIDKLQKFSVSECRNKFAVAVASPTMIKAYDVKLSITGRSNRTSFVIAPDGKILYSYSSLDYRGHVANTMAAVKAWHENMPHKM
jgi:thioredoxin-dependent peroxiredoxin